MIVQIFCVPADYLLYLVEKGMLKFPAVTVDLSMHPSSSDNLCFIYLYLAMLEGAYI